MSYDIELINKKTKETLYMRNPQYIRGGTVPAVEVNGTLVQAQQTEASINITYNYGRYYHEATEGDPRFAHDEISCYYADGTTGPVETQYGLRGLYGKTPEESIPMLKDMILRIEEKYKKNGEWINSKRKKTIFYDEEGNEIRNIIYHKFSQKKPCTEKEIEIVVNEGEMGDYWEPTAANAIRPLYDMLHMATDCLCEKDAVWDGD